MRVTLGGERTTQKAGNIVGRFLVVLLALGSVAGTSAPTHDAPAPAISPEPINAGMELARLIYPASLNSTIVAYTFENIVGPGYRADPNLKALEAAHPGIIDAILAAMRPEFERGRTDALSVLWAETGDLYARRLDPTELRQAIAFHGSPVGLQLRAVEAQDVTSAGEESAEVVLRSGPALEVGAAKAAFDATSAGRKLIALRAEVDAINASWNKAPMLEVNARIEAALAKVMTRFGVKAGRTK